MLEFGAQSTGFDDSRVRFRVERQQPVHARHVEGDDHADGLLRVDAADDVGAAAERDEADAVLVGQRDDSLHVLVAFGINDEVGGGARCLCARKRLG